MYRLPAGEAQGRAGEAGAARRRSSGGGSARSGAGSGRVRVSDARLSGAESSGAAPVARAAGATYGFRARAQPRSWNPGGGGKGAVAARVKVMDLAKELGVTSKDLVVALEGDGSQGHARHEPAAHDHCERVAREAGRRAANCPPSPRPSARRSRRRRSPRRRSPEWLTPRSSRSRPRSPPFGGCSSPLRRSRFHRSPPSRRQGRRPRSFALLRFRRLRSSSRRRRRRSRLLPRPRCLHRRRPRQPFRHGVAPSTAPRRRSGRSLRHRLP